MDDEDRRMETHPDLLNPDWQKYAERDAWLGAKKDLKKRRKREQRTVRTPGQSRWPGLLALLLVVGLIAAAVVVHQVQGEGGGVNEIPYLVVRT